VANWNPSATPGVGGRIVWVQNGDAVFQANGVSTVTVSGTVQANSITFNGTGYTIAGTTLTLTGSNITANVDGTISAPLAGTVGLTKAGSGTLTLSGTNTYTGATTIGAGTLQLGNGGTTGSLSTSSAITDNANLTINHSDAVVQGTDFSGAAITGSGSFTQAGTGTTTLNVANSYSGGTTVTAGILAVSNVSGLGTGGLTVNGGIVDLTVNGTYSIANLQGSGGTIESKGNNTNVVLSVGSDNTSTSFAGVLDESGNPNTTLSLTKVGTGALTLTGASNNHGTTTINAGTLLANNPTSSTGSGAVIVNNTGTVGGSGKITGSVTLNNSAKINGGGTVGAIGTLTTGALTLNNTSILSVDMTSTTADKISVIGGVSLASTSVLQLNIPNGTTFTTGQQFTLLDNDLADAISGAFSNAPTGTDFINGYFWTVSYTGGTGNDFVLTAAIPEPSTWLAGGLLLSALICSQRRRFRCVVPFGS
jgi:fibronectin-binding autotransporter adhesin